MGIVLNEHYSAEQAIQSRSLGKKPSETLARVARYYIDTNQGIAKNQLIQKIERFLLLCEPTASVPKWTKMINYAVDLAFKREAINIESIIITKPEITKIETLKGKQIRRLAFVLLCLSKYWDTVNGQNDHWVNSKDNEIMSLANINTSIKRQCAMYASLRDYGMIQFSKKVDNTNVKVCFAEDGESAIEITDLRNLGYQYLKYLEEHYSKYAEKWFFECECCGITSKSNNPLVGRKQKYCKECATSNKLKQCVNSVMRQRSQDKPCKITLNDNESSYVVYMHECPNGKRYVGYSKSPYSRWSNGNGYKSNTYFYDDIKMYGWDAIEHYIILETNDEQYARKIESIFIQHYKTSTRKHGYNKVSGKLIYEYDDDIISQFNVKKVNGDSEQALK